MRHLKATVNKLAVILIPLIVLSLILGTTGCSSGSPEEQKFAEAVQTNTVISYNDFLAEYPEGNYADCAKAMLKVFPSNAFIRPIEVSRMSPEFSYQVFCPPKADIKNTTFLLQDYSPFYAELPQYSSASRQFSWIKYRMIVKQAIVTTNQGHRELANTDMFGSNAVRSVLIIDNATETDISVLMDTCMSKMTLVDSVLSKSHICIQLSLDNHYVEIIHMKITRKDTSEVMEEFYFPVDALDPLRNFWYVYNVGRVNSYSTITGVYE